MSVALAQPIAGVSANREAEIETIYPSVAAGLLGQIIGQLMEAASSVPTTPLRIIAQLIMGTLLAPLALLAYALSKLAGSCYQLTNRSVVARKLIGGAQAGSVSLSDIGQIAVEKKGGYTFHRVGDVLLESATGQTLLKLTAVPYPERVRQVIDDARQARLRSDDALRQISARAK